MKSRDRQYWHDERVVKFEDPDATCFLLTSAKNLFATSGGRMIFSSHTMSWDLSMKTPCIKDSRNPVYDVGECDETLSTFIDARRQLDDMRVAGGYNLVVAVVDGGKTGRASTPEAAGQTLDLGRGRKRVRRNAWRFSNSHERVSALWPSLSLGQRLSVPEGETSP